MITMASMTQPAQRHRVLASDSRRALLAALRAAGRPLSVAEAAETINLQPSTTRFHLDLLVSAGLVESSAERRTGPGRPALRYRERTAEDESVAPASGGRSAGAALAPVGEDNYQQLASVLAGSLSLEMDPSRAARDAGRRWSQALSVDPGGSSDPIEAVVELMDRLGFAPERPVVSDELRLNRCPFEVVARESRQVVCGVHQGMLEETFRHLGGSVGVSGLVPFVNNEPLLCVVHLTRSTAPGTVRQAPVKREGVASPRSSQLGPDRAGEPPHA
jgi:predicted ArsR family transcriptional regulator